MHLERKLNTGLAKDNGEELTMIAYNVTFKKNDGVDPRPKAIKADFMKESGTYTEFYCKGEEGEGFSRLVCAIPTTLILCIDHGKVTEE